MKISTKKAVLAYLEKHDDGSKEAAEIIREVRKDSEYSDCGSMSLSAYDLTALSDELLDKLRKKLHKLPGEEFSDSDVDLVAEALEDYVQDSFGELLTGTVEYGIPDIDCQEGDNSVYSSPVVSARMVYERICPYLRSLDHEECWAVFLNDTYHCISSQRLSCGVKDHTVIEVSRVPEMARRANATNIILVHNHPSGDPRPSADDIRTTAALKKALNQSGIRLTDHVIVSSRSFFSFYDGEALRG